MSILERLANNSRAAIDDGTYEVSREGRCSDQDLEGVIRRRGHAPVITEIKFASPSMGRIRTSSDPARLACEMVAGGACALSVLTQPNLFGGSPDHFLRVRESVRVPLLMKDVIIDEIQVEAAERMGADYILLIHSIFDHGYADRLDRFVSHAHERGLGVLLEVHDSQEFVRALETEADLIGINNRDLDTLKVDMDTTERVLSGYDGRRVVVAESGISNSQDILRMRRAGASAFLVGSSIMRSEDVRKAVRGMVEAY